MRRCDKCCDNCRFYDELDNTCHWWDTKVSIPSGSCICKEYVQYEEGEDGTDGEYAVVLPFGEEEKKTFCNEESCRSWIMSGIYACEGAEQEHYVNMLKELEAGYKTLHY